MIAFLDDPKDYKVLLAISLASFGVYGLLTIGYVLVNKNCGHKARGSVMGISALFGAFGILFVAKIGGILFDYVSKSSPFICCSAFSFLLFCIVLIPKVRISLDNQEEEEKICPVE
jgi:MFS family permease